MKSPKYLAWVREQDCLMTGAPADDPHHITGVGNFSGMGMKPPDYLCMPLCREAHSLIHNDPAMWPAQWEFIVRTLDKAFRDGVIVFSEDYR